MKKENIIQFVGFITQLNFTEFEPQWEEYTRQIVKSSGARLLQCQERSANGLKYISQHELHETGFFFNFMKERKSGHFPDQEVKVVQAGGYSPLRVSPHLSKTRNNVSVIAFLGHGEKNISSCFDLVGADQPDIYQAYFENCAYGHILELSTSFSEATSLVEQLKNEYGVEAAIYEECKVPKLKPILYNSIA
ncbi:MAG TPA: hypothetical protein PKC72_09005 [Chitinophagaceae bacterium]|nr:hypothetical protein [Chitinophagaceae bacterium]